MKSTPVSTAWLVLWLAIATGCASLDTLRHEYIMRGQILDVTDGQAYLCIGSAHGAQVGQELTVYRFTRVATPIPVKGNPPFKKEPTGTVRITEIVNEHFARAQVLTGKAEVNSVVELQSS